MIVFIHQSFIAMVSGLSYRKFIILLNFF